MPSLRRDAWPDLVRLGWPISTTLLLRVTMRTVDILVVGIAVGAAGVAAVGVGDAVARLVLFTGLGLGAGTIATVSQATGGLDPRRAAAATTHSTLLAVALGLPFALLGWYGSAAVFRVLGAANEVVVLGVDYLRIVLASAPARMLAIVLTRAYQGAGDTRTPLLVRGLGTGLNIGLTVLLVPGLAGLPALGVEGAAVATATGNVVSAVVLALAVTVGRGGLGWSRAALRDLRPAWRILRIGGPQILERNLYALGAFPLNAITLSLGTSVNAGLQVGQRIMLYGVLPGRGIGTAASSLAGTALGAGDPDRADHVARSGLSLSVLTGLPVVLASLLFAEPLARVFVDDPETLASAVGWVRVYGVSIVFRALFGTMRGSFDAGGDTRPPLVASALGIGVGTVGLSWLLGLQLGLGVTGVFIGVLVDPVLRTAVLWRLFAQGRWLRRLDDGPGAGRASPAAPPPSGERTPVTSDAPR